MQIAEDLILRLMRQIQSLRKRKIETASSSSCAISKPGQLFSRE